MSSRKFLVLLLLVATLRGYAQENFTISPLHPKAGDLITFTYEPAGDIANTSSPVEAGAYQLGNKGQKAFDVPLTRVNKKLTGSVQTDTSGNFVYFSFGSDKKYDNNFNNGYTIKLTDGEKVKKGSGLNEALYYQYYGASAGVERSPAKALKSYEAEFAAFPDSRKANLPGYLRLWNGENKDAASAAVQKEIETALKDGLKEESDYALLESLYGLAKLPQQAKLITTLKKEKYPNGKWVAGETINKFYAEENPAKKKEILALITDKVNTDANWENYKQSINYFKMDMVSAYAGAKDWDNMKKTIADLGIKDNTQLASLYNNTAWEMQKDSTNLAYAEEMSRFAVETAKKEWKTPTAPKPDYLTSKQWDGSRKSSYAMYADTYAMIMYRLGQYKKGLPYAKDAAIVIAEGKNADENGTYALLAEKVLPAKDYKKQLEQFVKDGKANSEIKGILKRAYVKEKKSEDGFEDYVMALQKDSYIKMLEELRKSMLNENAPTFALYNLEGNKIDINDLKGKVVVVDFWATWCGPCKASFPGMQKAVTKYKDDPNVKFIFVDTWEKGEEKKKNAADFIAKNKYSFDVLLDNDDKVITSFKVDGIPTKFILDKEGKIRFKAVGFDGNDEKLVQELTAMIEMAGNPDKKAF